MAVRGVMAACAASADSSGMQRSVQPATIRVMNQTMHMLLLVTIVVTARCSTALCSCPALLLLVLPGRSH